MWRDQAILWSLHVARAMSTLQIAVELFPGQQACKARTRLNRLRGMGLVERHRGGQRTGSEPGLPILNKARGEQGLAPLTDWTAQLLGAREICMMTAPELDFSSRGVLPANVRYVGPAFEPHPGDWRSPWPETNDDPLVVISFSTSYMNQRPLAQRVLDAIAGLPVRALLTAGPALETDTLRIPANTRSVPYVPHRSVFPQAALVITHAGWQTINAALADGVPLLCIPDGRDQPDNAQRVVLTGAGAQLRKGASIRRLRRMILHTLQDPELRQCARAMAEALARSDGAVAITERIERLAARTTLTESLPAPEEN